MIDKLLGQYRIGEQLIRGGMSDDYLADNVSLDRKVALKFLPDALFCLKASSTGSHTDSSDKRIL
jgi:hypothetical protein